MPSTTTVATGYVVNVGAVTLIGDLFGMPLEAMVIGTVAGALVFGRQFASSRTNALLSIITSAILAGVFSPLLIELVSAQVDIGHQEAEHRLLKLAVPFLVGAGWSWIYPLLNEHGLAFLNKFLSKWSGKQ